MKTFLHTLFFIFVVTQICFAQWFWQNPLPQGNTLNAVNFISTTVGWAFGDYGTIVKTTNSGINWSLQTSGTTAPLNDVSFTDINNGTAVGDFGTIIRTTNGGINWSLQTSGITTHLNGVSFTDVNYGTAVGDYGKILRTTNGGISWTQQTSGTTYSLYAVSFTDMNKGTAVGDYGKILRTTNGGTNWIQQTSGTPYSLYDVSFIDANYGTAVGDGKILRTTNGGTNWTQQSSGTTYSLYDVSFTDMNKGTAVGDNGTILRTTNGGTNWTKQTSGTAYSLYNVSFTDANNGTAVGVSGTILRTTNGGTTWVSQLMGRTSFFMWDASFIDSQTGFAVGDNGTILKTTNSGTNWTPQISGITSAITDLCFINSNNAWAVSDNGTILRTTNGGINWIQKTILATASPRGVAFTDANNGIVVGELITITTNSGTEWIQPSNGATYKSHDIAIRDAMRGINNTNLDNVGIIQRTTNGGIDWTIQSNGTIAMLYGVYFANTNNGWAVGNNGTILKTTNGGINWTQQISGTTSDLRGVTFTDVNNGIVVGGLSTSVATILKTTNGGTNWVQQSSEATKILLDVSFSDANYGIAVGDYGTILRSTNGGINWTQHLRGTGYPLFGACFTDESTGWAVGQNGTILKYSDKIVFTRDINVLQGWNMLSVPIFASDMRANSLFPGAISNYFAYIDRNYVIVDTLENGKSYWAKYNSNQAFQVVGNLIDPPNIPVNSGWNMIGPFQYDFPVSNITSSPSGIIASNFFGYNYGYQIPDILKEGKGYWVKVSQTGILHMNNLLNKPLKRGSVERAFAEVNFNISDGVGGTALLKTGIDPRGTDGIDSFFGEYELPPLPPPGIFDARFNLSNSITSSTDIRQGTDSGAKEKIHQIQIQTGAETVELNYDFGGYTPDQIKARLQDIITGTLIDTIIYGSGSYTIHNPMIFNRLRLTMIYGSPIPVEIVSFSAATKNNHVELNWTTAKETNNCGFSIERKNKKDLDWKAIGFVESKGTTIETTNYSYTDKNLGIGVYSYRLKQMDFHGGYENSKTVEIEFNIPSEFTLEQNYPNPFNNNSVIKYSVPQLSFVKLKIFNSLGEEIETIVNQEKPAGSYEFNWNPANLTSGVYFYRLQSGSFVETKKMILLK